MPLLGIVTAFDDPAGLGEITSADGRRVPFHCTQLADGSRTTTVGAEVAFELWPRLGRYEAASIRPVAPA